MTEMREAIIQEFPDVRVVINAKDVQGAFRFGLSRVPARPIDGLQMMPGNLRQIRRRINQLIRIADYGRSVHVLWDGGCDKKGWDDRVGFVVIVG